MSTFLFAAGVRGRPVETFFSSVAEIIRELMPSQGIPLATAMTLLPEMQGGWVWLTPTPEQPPAMLDAVVQKQQAVLVFGYVTGKGSRSSADLVLRTWKTGGVGAVRTLDGSFSAVLVDRSSQEVALVCDSIGHRYLRYLADGEGLLISPHDLAIVATGRCRLDMDLTSACSIVTWGWSLLGGSLLRPLGTLRSTRIVRWSRDRLTEVVEPVLTQAERISPRYVSRHLDKMIESMRFDARLFAGQGGPLNIFLTAGIDTRTILSLLLSVVDGARIHALTYGEPDSLEVRVARRLARWANCHFFSTVPQSATEGAFLRHCDVRAFHLNGDTSSKRALDAMPPYTPQPEMRISGGAGEIYRGYFYGARPRWGAGFDAEGAFQVLLRRTRSMHAALAWLDPEQTRQWLIERLRQAMTEYARPSSNGYDLLDRFYLHDRVGVWGAQGARLPWHTRSWKPFQRLELIQLAFQMPPPIGYYCRIHETLIRRYLPKSYYFVRINGQVWLPLEGGGQLRQSLRQLDQKCLAAVAQLQRRPNQPFSRERTRTVEQIRTDLFSGPLASLVRELIEARAGFGFQLFGAQGLERILQEHRDRRRNHLEALSSLVTMERWRSLMEKAAQKAAAHRG